MAFLDYIGITTALAQTPAANVPPQTAGQAMLSMLPMLIIIVAVFYFLFVRPQSKRAKDQRKMLDSLSVGDEILTAGGIVGQLSKLTDNYITLTIAPNVNMVMQKNSIVGVLPKGTIEGMK